MPWACPVEVNYHEVGDYSFMMCLSCVFNGVCIRMHTVRTCLPGPARSERITRHNTEPKKTGQGLRRLALAQGEGQQPLPAHDRGGAPPAAGCGDVYMCVEGRVDAAANRRTRRTGSSSHHRLYDLPPPPPPPPNRPARRRRRRRGAAPQRGRDAGAEQPQPCLRDDQASFQNFGSTCFGVQCVDSISSYCVRE